MIICKAARTSWFSEKKKKIACKSKDFTDGRGNWRSLHTRNFNAKNITTRQLWESLMKKNDHDFNGREVLHCKSNSQGLDAMFHN